MKIYFTIILIGLTSLLIANKSNAQSGSLDYSFNPGTGISGAGVYCMALATNGQIIIGGDFSSYNGANLTRVARLNSDGSLDTSFDPGVGPSGEVDALAIQSDGKIVIVGHFGSVNGITRNGVARLRSDGSLDTSFNSTIVGGNTGLLLLPNGSLFVGGSTLSKLNTNGAVDGTFTQSTLSSSSYVLSVGQQSNGQIIVGGNFTTINGVSKKYLARLNYDGSVDTNFDAGLTGPGGNIGVKSLMVLTNDQIVIAGGFTSANGYSRPGIARLNADGGVDTTFNAGFGADGIINIAIQNDGKIVLGGSFSYVNNTNRSDIARLNANGGLDLGFNPGSGTDFTIYCVASQPDGKALIGGNFYHFNGTNISGIARLNGDNSATNVLALLSPAKYFGTYVQGTVSNSYRIEWTGNLSTHALWTPLFNVTLQTNPQFILDPTPISGQRYYRAVTLP